MYKKLIGGLAIISLLGTLTACGSDSATTSQSSSSEKTEQVSSSSKKKSSEKASSTSSMEKSSSTSSSESEKASPSSEAASSLPSTTTATGVKDDVTGLDGAPQAPLTFTGSQQLVLADRDSLGRARDAHIQLQDKDEPTGERDAQINVNPVGWRNYNYYYKANDGSVKRAWLFDRGHLVGYQFSGLNDELRNLVPETTWLNRGAFAGMNDGNEEGMLYYENRLDSWLATHPNYFLDYQVTPLYEGNQLWPQKIRLAYVGIDSSGQHMQIRLGSDKEREGTDDVTIVYLDNAAPNATIDFNTLQVTNTVEPAATPPASSSSTSTQAPSADATSQRTVYITGGGKSKVYWYSKDNMPSSTNMNNIIEMTESEAIAAGKRHSMNE